MNLLFFTEARLTRTADNKYYSTDQSFSYQMFNRYNMVFDKVIIVARAYDIRIKYNLEINRVDNNGVKVLPLPYYIGPYQYLVKKKKLIKKITSYIDSNLNTAIICRVPGTIGTAAARYLIKKNRRYGVEVTGNPHDVFAPGSFNHILRALFRYYGIKNLKSVVKEATASIYVTKASLQNYYPSSNHAFSTYASNVMLPPDAFVAQAKALKKNTHYSIVAIGSLEAMYKSPDIAIEAIKTIKKRGMHVSLYWIGGGRYQGEMVALAKQTGVSDWVTFVGHIGSADEVRKYLDAADLFVIPSRTEGLPRALVEAMARGLPCIGADIGGIPELLEKEALVPINNATALADKIFNFLTNPELADAQAKRNLTEAQTYAFKLLESRRMEFYEYLKGIS